MSNCHCHDEVKRDGSAQINRYLKALDPAYAPVDGRSLEDLLVFAKRYAAQIRFYDIPESKVEPGADPAKISWREFFRRDMAVIAASIAVTDLQQIKKDYDEIRDRLDLDPTNDAYGDLFDPILGILKKTDRWYSIAIPENPLHADLVLAINSNLKDLVGKMIAYEEGFTAVDVKHPLKLDFTDIENPDVWGVNDKIDADDTIYVGADAGDKIKNAALYVDDIFNGFYGFISKMVDNAEGYLQYALTQYPAHQPHMALFITFLQLYRLAQDQMNGITEGILNFYYRDVLHLAEKPSIPDKVYVVLELAKDVAAYDLAAGTEFKAGKDASGKDMFYKTSDDFVANQAKVKELKTLFIEKSSAVLDNGSSIATIQSVFARPIANSLDGFGEKITDPSGKWMTFGKGAAVVPNKHNPCEILATAGDEKFRKDQAQLGFAIASPQFLLQGGKRLISLSVRGLSVMLATAKGGADPFEILLTGEKGWVKITQVMKEAEFTALSNSISNGVFGTDTSGIGTSYYIGTNALMIYLPVAEQAIVPYSAKLHPGIVFGTEQPMMQVLLNKNLQLYERVYNLININNMSVDIKVGSINPKDKEVNYFFDGLKTLVIQNDDGTVQPNKPFDPFTAYPTQGKSLYIGSQEVFNKPLDELAVNIRNTSDIALQAMQLKVASELSMSTYNPPDYNVSLLQGKEWQPLSTDSGNTQFQRLQLTSDILYKANYDSTGQASGVKFDIEERKPIRTITALTPQTDKGFIRLDNLRAVTYGENSSFLQASQNMAADLQVKEISVSYQSSLSQLESGVDQFFHVYPFGVVETYLDKTVRNELRQNVLSVLSNKLLAPTQEQIRWDRKQGGQLVDAHNLLFPQFTWLGPYSDFAPAPKISTNIKLGGMVKEYQELQKIGLLVEGTDTGSTNQPPFNYDNVVAYSTHFTNDASGVNQYSGHVEEQGSLFIGLENLQPLQSVSLLFQFAEGSALDEDDDPPQIHWSYLSNNEWKPLKGENLISDSTQGFQTTGIVKIDVPDDATTHNTIITDGLLWFCASVTSDSDRIPQLIGVVAQAVTVTFEDKGNDQSHFDAPLPAGSISKLAVTVNEVSKVTQPYASFDGKHTEVGKEFYTRVSERLRHKGRAITAWDYEHLVLDRFPGIYKVKCLTHTDPNCLCRHTTITQTVQATRIGNADSVGGRETLSSGLASGQHPPHSECCGPQIAPGHILIVPISDLKNRNAANPLQPKTSRKTLLDIEAYLQTLTSPFVKVHAKNPVYEQIICAFRVQFTEGIDKGYYLKKLNEELVHYLTPWAFDAAAEVKFDEKVYASSIIAFIESRSYVDFITDFFMGVCRNECCPEIKVSKPKESGDGNEINTLTDCDDLERLMKSNAKFIGETEVAPSTPRSILVSVVQHVIIPYEAPDIPSLCDRRKMNNVDNTPVIIAPAPEQQQAQPTQPSQPTFQPKPMQPVQPAQTEPMQPVQPANTAPMQPVQPTKNEVVANPPKPVAVVTAADNVVKPATVDTALKNADNQVSAKNAAEAIVKADANPPADVKTTTATNEPVKKVVTKKAATSAKKTATKKTKPSK
ncbi:hypothetical protein [Taibaiella soli]|uniref:Baseplate protein J-like domain-containing protein n=1 Tax=Taibaiella soli TaxID=1649169 RepID=A0A2W2BIW4_9BACT|nr:hypothetical protein [Taibaiella soli]PZF73386.1 hypothetical protein DN068_08320 [Taibaiella soli]